MPLQSSTHLLEVWGDFACFTRPEMKVERYSYPCPTPGAARGIFEAVFFKPQFCWHVSRIELLSVPAYIPLRRNEVKDKISVREVQKWMKGTGAVAPLWADADQVMVGTDKRGRTQRQTMALRRPRFRLTARIVPRRGSEPQQAAFDDQFVRRASNGKCFQQPYLGCREFVAFFRYVPTLDGEPSPVAYSQELGMMLYDVFDLEQTNNSSVRPFVTVFRAVVVNGVLEVPPFDSAEVLKPERRTG